MQARVNRFLALSGSARSDSTNTALLSVLAGSQPLEYQVRVYKAHHELPLFTPDNEGDRLPHSVKQFCEQVDAADGLIISSPEYVRAIPGGLKNAIDWLVSREEIVCKPVVLAHASHRGEDMLASLRLVLATVSSRFDGEHFLRFPLMKMSPSQVQDFLCKPESELEIRQFLAGFNAFVNRDRDANPQA